MARSPSHSPEGRELDFAAAKVVQSIAKTTATNFFTRILAIASGEIPSAEASPDLGPMTDLLPGSPSFFNDGDQAEVLPAAHQPRKVAKRKSASTDPTAPAQNAKAGTSGHRTAEQEEILYIQKLCQMSGPELEVEKKKVKSGLKAFDEDFYRRHRRNPSKLEKEAIRPKYELYNDIKLLLANAAKAAAGDRTTETAISLEKKLLQRRLRRFESQFEARERRKVKYHKDIASVRATYQRYKNLKRILQNG